MLNERRLSVNESVEFTSVGSRLTRLKRKPDTSSSPTLTEAGGSSTRPKSELVTDILEGRTKSDQTRIDDKKKSMSAGILHEFMVMLSVCHTVIPEKVDNEIIYHAASPGELQKNKIKNTTNAIHKRRRGINNVFSYLFIYP